MKTAPRLELHPTRTMPHESPMFSAARLAATRALAAILVVSAVARGARAQRDDFDEFAPPPPNTTSATPPVVTVDTPVPDANASVIVRVVATRALELTNTPTLACARGRIAVGTTQSNAGLLMRDGAWVLVPSATVEGANAIVVHGATPGETHAALLVRSDRAAGLALLRLVTPLPATGDADAAIPAVGDAVTSLTRLENGALFQETARVQGARGDELGVAIDSPGLSAGRVIFRAGAPIGMFTGAFSPSFRSSQVWSIAAIRRLFADELADEVAMPVPELVASIEAASRMLTALGASPTAAARCALLEAARAEPSAPAVADVPLASELDTGRTDVRILLAAYAWNRAVSAANALLEPEASSPAYGWIARAYERDAQAAGGTRFASQVNTMALAQAQAERTAALALAERQRVDEEAARVRERRLRRAATYTTGLAGTFARDGTSGLGGALVTAGVFGSVPRLAATGSFRAALAIGTSVALGGNGGFTGLLTLDLGATMRFGGTHGGFLLVAYAPGFVTRVLPETSPFVASSYRAAAGFTLGRRVMFVGYRVLAPSGDYPLHLLELGIAFRHGPPEPTNETETAHQSQTSL